MGMCEGSIRPAAVRERVETTREYEIKPHQIVRYLRDQGLAIPPDARIGIFVTVPGGGDWSNTDLQLSDECVAETKNHG
jgi:hypothetical protein